MENLTAPYVQLYVQLLMFFYSHHEIDVFCIEVFSKTSWV